MRRIGMLMSLTPDDPDGRACTMRFCKDCSDRAGSMVAIFRLTIAGGGGGDADNFRKYAAELVALNPDALLASGTVTVAPLLGIAVRSTGFA